jgi:hypothetical protein
LYQPLTPRFVFTIFLFFGRCHIIYCSMILCGYSGNGYKGPHYFGFLLATGLKNPVIWVLACNGCKEPRYFACIVFLIL